MLANSADPGSLAVARHYLKRRRVPSADLFALPMPVEETISWPQFVNAVWNPLRARLIAAGWIDAVPLGGRDPLGRVRYAATGQRIGALVVCRGVPLRIENAPDLLGAIPASIPKPEFRTNAGAVDSELSLLACSRAYPIDGFVLNPLFGKPDPDAADEQAVVKVGRLDGPTVAEAEALVDGALAGERRGLRGRAYVDECGKYPDGDAWLARTARIARRIGFDTAVDRSPNVIPIWARFDAPALYFGWYAENLIGPFQLPGFRFPPGAIALHIYSFSAWTLRSDRDGWCGPLVARGAAATVGNVWEPFLQLTHRPDYLLAALARGDTLADAAYYALPALSWECILIGDPLYRPFLRAPVSLALSGGKPGNLGTALTLAERQEDAHRPSEAVALLTPWLGRPTAPSDEWGTLAEAARTLVACGRADLALGVYRKIFAWPNLPLTVRAHWLVSAAAVARGAGEGAQAEAWRREMERDVRELVAAPIPPEPPPPE